MTRASSFVYCEARENAVSSDSVLLALTSFFWFVPVDLQETCTRVSNACGTAQDPSIRPPTDLAHGEAVWVW